MAIFKKERKYNQKVDLNEVVNKFAGYLMAEKWKVQQNVQGDKGVIQAQKGGILRDIVAADRALTFTFENSADGLKVTTGVGKWIQNIGVMVAEVIILSELFIVVDVPEMLWTEHVESGLLKKLDQIVKENTV
ncbi:MAG: hypothetical protein QXG99_06690 [Conexivisphaerales archaeon]